MANGRRKPHPAHRRWKKLDNIPRNSPRHHTKRPNKPGDRQPHWLQETPQKLDPVTKWPTWETPDWDLIETTLWHYSNPTTGNHMTSYMPVTTLKLYAFEQLWYHDYILIYDITTGDLEEHYINGNNIQATPLPKNWCL